MAGERTVKIKFDGDTTGLKKSAEQGERAVSGWSKGVDKAGKAVAASAALAGAAIVAAFGAAVGAGLEQSQIKAKLAAQLGATGADAKRAGDAAGDLYSRGVVGSFEEAADAVKTIFQNGLVPKNAGKAEIDAVAARVSSLATSLDEDASAVGRAVSQMLRTGIAKSSTEAFDILAKGTQLGINKSEDLLDTFNEYGTQFRKLGIEGPQALGLLSQGLKAGARDSDLVADALKEFSIRAVAVGDPNTQAGFKALGLNAKTMAADIGKGGASANKALDVTIDRLRNIKDPVKQAAVATQLFGTQSEDLGKALFALDPSKAVASIGSVGGAADKMGKTLEESAGAKVQAFQRVLQEKLITALAATVDWLDKNQQLVKTLALVLGPIAAIITTIVIAVKIWTAVQLALNFVLTANPIGLVIAGIALLVAGIVIIATKTKFFQKTWEVVWGAIKSATNAVVSFFRGVVFPFYAAQFNALMNILRAVGSVFKAIWNAIVAAVRFAVNAYATYINTLVAILRRIITTVGSVVSYVQGRFNALISYIAGLGKRVASASRGLFDGIKNAFRSAINFVVDRWNNLSFSLPSINTPFGKIGGTTLNTPNIPRLASGGWAQANRTFLAGENGPELISIGQRAHVASAGQTADMLGAAPVVHVYIGDRELTDIVDVRIETNNRQTRRRVGALGGAFA